MRPVDLSTRRGSILLVVLVVVALLTLATYTFTESMLMEAEAAAMFGRTADSYLLAESGVEWAAATLGDRASGVNLFDSQDMFQGVLVHDGTSPRERGRFSLVSPDEGDPARTSIRYGFVDESSKLNLNALMGYGLSESDLQKMLMYLPGMTADVADAILDWLDEDEIPRLQGAEVEYYGTLNPPYAPPNGPLVTLDDLLLVRGVTPELLYGEDANRNGLLDPNENDGEAGPPWDDADGALNPGWAAFLTTDSREANLRSDGTPRIKVNEQDLATLYDQLELEFGQVFAQFVTAYRMSGPAQTGRRSRGGGRSGRGGRSGGEQGTPGQGESGQGAGGENGAQGTGGVMRGGLDLSRGAQVQVDSLYHLIGVQVQVDMNGTQTTLTSPWSSDPGMMQQYLPEITDKLTVSTEPYTVGRINVNLAPREVLLGIPGMSESLAETIALAAALDPVISLAPEEAGVRATTGWLLVEGIATLDELRLLDKYLTAGGDVYRVQSVGHFDAGSPVARLEAVLDAGQSPARVISVRDLTHLGPGYRGEHLAPAGFGY